MPKIPTEAEAAAAEVTPATGDGPPVLWYATPVVSRPSSRPHAGVAILAVILVVASLVAVATDPFGLIAPVFWMNVVAAVAVPAGMWLTRPRSIHWAAGALFAVVLLAAAFLCLYYVAMVGASV